MRQVKLTSILSTLATTRWTKAIFVSIVGSRHHEEVLLFLGPFLRCACTRVTCKLSFFCMCLRYTSQHACIFDQQLTVQFARRDSKTNSRCVKLVVRACTRACSRHAHDSSGSVCACIFSAFADVPVLKCHMQNRMQWRILVQRFVLCNFAHLIHVYIFPPLQVLLSCSHVFHSSCIKSFEKFAQRLCCPL